jgi:transglutaminase-like putative cysteine protease
VNTPPGLVGAALLFWGWQTGLAVLAVPFALLLEGARLVGWRWDLARAELDRVADLCRLILVALAVYLAATRGSARVVLGLVEWFPLAVLPLVVCQAYGTGDRIGLRTFFLILRRRTSAGDQPVDPAYPYVALCMAAASAANVRSPGFYLGLCTLTAWALWSQKPAAAARPVWLGMLAVGAVAGYGGHLGLHELQAVVESTLADWVFDYMGRDTDPYRSRTAIGSIGRLKLSDRIVLRVDTGEPVSGPLLLHEASYNFYAGGVWGAVDAGFEAVPPEPDRRTWQLLPATAPADALTVSVYLKRGRGVVPLPPGTFRVDGLLALQMKRNRLGAVKVEEGLGLASYRALFAPTVSLDGAPTEMDLRIAKLEGPLLARLAAELGLPAKSPREALGTITAYLRERFRYSTYLAGPPRGAAALEDFFLRSRAGHCEYFATATVLLLRAAGIPARYATGYSVQEWSPREGRYLVRARHAHAWAVAHVEGGWRDLDTTPSVWASAEAEGAARWEPLTDLASWAFFLFSRWRWGDREAGMVRYAGWLLLPLFGVLAWRLYFRRRVAREAAAAASAVAPRPRPGEDSEFYLIERHFAERGLGRRPAEPVAHWLARIRTAGPTGVTLERLPAIAALHYRYRFDPRGLGDAERHALQAGVHAWLAEHAGSR